MPAGEGLELGEDRRAIVAPAGGPDLAPVDDRQADPADEALEHGLVHAEGRRRHAGAGVGEAGGLEHRLDGPVLAERTVEGDEHDRRGIARGEPVERGAGAQRALGAERRRVVVGGLRAGRRGRWSGGSHHQRAVEVDQDLADVVAAVDRSAAAIAVPDTIETSCSAEGPPRSTTIGGGCAWSSARPSALGAVGSATAAVPVAEEHDLRLELHAGARANRSGDLVDQAPDVGGGALPVVDDEVRVLLGDGRATVGPALPAQRNRSAGRPSRPADCGTWSRPTGSRAADGRGASA